MDLYPRDYPQQKYNNNKAPRKRNPGLKHSKSLFDLSFLAGNDARTFKRRHKNQLIVSTWSLFEMNKKDIPPRARPKSLEPNISRTISVDTILSEDRSQTNHSYISGVTESSSSKTVTSENDDFSDDFSDSVFTDEELPENITHGLKHLSRSTPTMSPSGSPPHSDSEGHVHISRRTKKFLRRFRSVPTTERVINYYACAIVSDILLQGTLYITDNYFAFYSNIFGYVNRTLIPIGDVCNIQKEKTAKFIPNAVGLQTIDGKTFVFSSLISRDTTYKFMTHMWRKYRKLTDSDLESTLPVQEEPYLNDSCSNSGDSAVEDIADYTDNNLLSPVSVVAQSATLWSESTPLKASGGQHPETSVSNSENDSSYTTPETCISSTSFNELKTSGDLIGTSGSELSQKKDNGAKKSANTNQSDSERNSSWLSKFNILKAAIGIGIAPFKAVKDGLEEITLSDSNVLLILSSSLVFMLFLSAAFMIYRVETLNEQIASDNFNYGNLYEEILRMQQKLHSATASEIEKTLSQQIQQLVTVKKSLEALVFLLNSDTSNSASHMQDSNYQTI